MNLKIVQLVFMIILFVSMINFVLAEEIAPAPSPSNQISNGDSFDLGSGWTQYNRYSEVLIYNISPAISLIIGILLIIFMIKNPSKTLNLIVQGLLFVWIIIYITIFSINSFIHDTASFGSTFEGIIEFVWPLILLLISSGYLALNLIRKKNFAKKMKYALGLSFGAIIAVVLEFIMLAIIKANFDVSPVLELGLFKGFIYYVGTVGIFILEIIGFGIDKFKR